MKSNLINQPHQNLNSDLELINPNSTQFDFKCWASAVRRQMLTVFESDWKPETKVDEEE